MPEEYFDVAYINFDKAILHGRCMLRDSDNNRIERQVEQVLTAAQSEALVELNERHQREREALLSSFVDRSIEATPA